MGLGNYFCIGWTEDCAMCDRGALVAKKDIEVLWVDFVLRKVWTKS
jgi:hypothetical protein